jgi:hypothetical protein
MIGEAEKLKRAVNSVHALPHSTALIGDTRYSFVAGIFLRVTVSSTPTAADRTRIPEMINIFPNSAYYPFCEPSEIFNAFPRFGRSLAQLF